MGPPTPNLGGSNMSAQLWNQRLLLYQGKVACIPTYMPPFFLETTSMRVRSPFCFFFLYFSIDVASSVSFNNSTLPA